MAIKALAVIDDVIDDPETDDFEAPIRYAVTCYGSDPDVESLVKRINRKEILIPSFQRAYVWNIREASRFIESLLLGLPVPGIFMAKEQDTNKLLVIDGQQRLKTLQFFFDGYFNPKEGETRQKVFRLTDVNKSFLNQSYATLSEPDRTQLHNSILHATIVKQDTPRDDDTSIYHIFARLNSGGQKLTPQEIRVAAYHGTLIQMVDELNDEPSWRNIFGKPSLRLKDQELILRFFAFYESASKYSRPMGEFLNAFASAHRKMSTDEQTKWKGRFLNTVGAIDAALGQTAFRPERGLNAAVFDSVAVGLARRFEKGPVKNAAQLRAAYEKLLTDPDYKAAVTSSTSLETSVALRIRRATEAFESLA